MAESGITQTIYLCGVCAFPYTEEIKNDEICVCCGFQKGVDDDPEIGEPIHKISQRWVLGGMRWWSVRPPAPDRWDPETYQLPWLISAYGQAWQE